MNRQHLQQLVAEGDIGPALQEILTLTTGTSLHNDALMISSRHHRNERARDAGTLDVSSFNIENNRISAALLNLIGRIKDDASQNPASRDGSTGTTIIQRADKIYNIGKIDEADFS
jgi:Effector-associated domain 11